jgi:hypothetical protein
MPINIDVMRLDFNYAWNFQSALISFIYSYFLLIILDGWNLYDVIEYHQE